jgi:hypothetical protein
VWSWLRPHRGMSQAKLPLYLGFFERVPNARKRGKALLHALIALSVGANATGWGSVIPDSFLPEAMERTGREPVPSLWSQVRPAARPSTAHSDSGLAVAMSSRGASPCVAATQASRLPEVWCGLTPPHGGRARSRGPAHRRASTPRAGLHRAFACAPMTHPSIARGALGVEEGVYLAVVAPRVGGPPWLVRLRTKTVLSET